MASQNVVMPITKNAISPLGEHQMRMRMSCKATKRAQRLHEAEGEISTTAPAPLASA